MPPRENSLGVPGQAASNAQNLQNVRQQGANYRGQQIYNDPTTHAGREAQAAWLKNNPIPNQSIDTVYGGVNYGNKLQKDTEVAVDQEQIGRGGPGTGNAMIRAGMLDANGYKPGTPGVNNRDTRSEATQYAEQNRVMADIQREKANGGIQNSRVNTINPSKRIDISGDRRRTEIENKWAPGSMDQGGANYAANGPQTAALVKKHGNSFGNEHANAGNVPPVPVAAPTPPPVAQTTPAPGAQVAQPKRDPYLDFLRQKGVIRPDGSFDNAAEANLSPEDRAQLKSFGTVQNPAGGVQNPVGGGQNLGGAQGAPTGSSLSPEQHAAMVSFQNKNNERMKAEGSTRPPDDYTKLSPSEQKSVYDFNLERGNIPRPVRPPTGQVPNPRNPNKDMNDRPIVPKQTGTVPPIEPPAPPIQPPKAVDPQAPKKTYQNLEVPENPEAPVVPPPKVVTPPPKVNNAGAGKLPTLPQEKEWNDNKSKGLQTDYDFKNNTENGAAASRKAAWDNGEYGNPTKFPNNPLDRKTQKAPQQQRIFGEQQVRPASEDEKGPHPLAIQKDRQALASKGLMGAMDRAKATENGQEINHENWMPDGKGDHRRIPSLSNKKDVRGFNTSGAQQVRPRTEDAKIGVNKMPPIKKSSPITDTIKASNNPVPVVDTPKPTQQAPAQRKPLFPRLRGRR